MNVPLTWHTFTCAFSGRWDRSWPATPDKRRVFKRSQKKARLNRRWVNGGRRK